MQIKFDLKDIYALADDLKVAVDQVPFAASKTVNECAIPSTAAKSESGSRRPGPTATRLPPQVVRAGAIPAVRCRKFDLTGPTS
jgi:hypothetical protein